VTNLKAVQDNNDLPNFLEFLFEGLEGYVSTAIKRTNPDGEIEFKRESFIWPQSKKDLQKWIENSSSSAEVYIAPNLFTQPGGKGEHFKVSNVVWSEFDGALPTDQQLGNIPEPSLRIRSSGENNEHWYWKLQEPISEAKTVESINRALTYQLGADVSGWDIGQVLRPPNTYNHKRQTPVSLVCCSNNKVAPIHFDVLPAYEPQVVDITPTAIPDVADVVFKYEWPAEVVALYRESAPPVGADRSAMLMRLGYYLAEMGMSDAEMFSIIRNADDRWGKFKDRTDRNLRLTQLIAKARQKFPVEVYLPDDAVPIYGLLSFLNTDVEIEWRIPGLLQSQGYMLLTGPAGVGKTQFSLRWAINLALGRGFLGLEVTEPTRILFWSLEMGHADLKFFLSTMCSDMSEEELLQLEQNLLIAPLGEAFYLDMKDTQKQFETILEEFKPEGVFIDSIGSSSSGAVSDENTVKSLMDFNDFIRNKYGIFTWFIHHNRKAQGDNKKPNKLADVYGNQYLVNRATSVYCLWPAANAIEVIPLKKRLSAMEEPWLITRFNNLDFAKKEITFKQTPKLLDLDELPTKPMGMGDI
jgi:hypothetical protein